MITVKQGSVGLLVGETETGFRVAFRRDSVSIPAREKKLFRLDPQATRVRPGGRVRVRGGDGVNRWALVEGIPAAAGRTGVVKRISTDGVVDFFDVEGKSFRCTLGALEPLETTDAACQTGDSSAAFTLYAGPWRDLVPSSSSSSSSSSAQTETEIETQSASSSFHGSTSNTGAMTAGDARLLQPGAKVRAKPGRVLTIDPKAYPRVWLTSREMHSDALEGSERMVMETEWRQGRLRLSCHFGVCGVMVGRVEGDLDDFELIQNPNTDPSVGFQVGDAVVLSSRDSRRQGEEIREVGYMTIVFGEFVQVDFQGEEGEWKGRAEHLQLHQQATRVRPGVRARLSRGSGLEGGARGLPPGGRTSVGFVRKVQFGQAVVDFFGITFVCLVDQLDVVEVAESGC
uniref:Uncharacterized protein n=1 Tax=Chromera velia CCMP2878 TaxID=1169474 RepID=A0A0G4HRL0_9ALVE|eukprot:Cvel_1296.t1-p1 / transcript=Cvel_1296.t1 / gene=Cvel_1296 / organism=Chromera_velia_CCMP2878 / gene_product=hypothetical protein / transcript_product=hypothetical protein / location=Cvel_scaffold43:153816-155592(-) / protein_length=399 / sequence_SO=supercontig / SO=protein_coding / is_pseudo=false